MAQVVARPAFHLAKFPLFKGHENEDLDVHVERFEVFCVAQGIFNDWKLQIFLATLQNEVLDWFLNLDLGSKATYQVLSTSFLTKF